jgi:diguanylate cyclase (GGDEF)-like protein/PAS domain S-box-containing protein
VADLGQWLDPVTDTESMRRGRTDAAVSDVRTRWVADAIPSPTEGSGPLPRSSSRRAPGSRHAGSPDSFATMAEMFGMGADTDRDRSTGSHRAGSAEPGLDSADTSVGDPGFSSVLGSILGSSLQSGLGVNFDPGTIRAVAPAGPSAGGFSLPSVPTLLCDAADRVLRTNAALLRMAGRDPRQASAAEGIVGRSVTDLLVGPDSDARLVRPDGALVRVRAVRWSLPTLGAEHGQVAGLRAIMLIDLTETSPPVTSRDDAGRQIAELRRLARVGNWSYDLRTGGLHREPALVELYRDAGIEPDTQPAGPIELEQVALLCKALRGALQRGSVDPGLEPGEQDSHHIEHRTAPPIERVLSCQARVERTPAGAPVRLVGTVQDITEQRLAQERMERATQRYLDLVTIAPVGVAVFNRAGQLVDANGSLCALLGSSAERLRGVTARSLSVEPAGPGDLAFLRMVRPGAAQGYRIPEYAVRRADGTTVWCELSVTVSVGDDGRQFWLVVFTDMSERRRAADVLRIAGTHDELTRLPNRSSAIARISRLLAGPERDKLAVLCCDVDDFKRVNTALGHLAGDQVLILLGARLQRELPMGCSAARLSGDEFVVVCDDIDAVGGVTELAETVAALVREPVVVDGQPVRVSAAIGAATSADGSMDGAGMLRGTPTAEDLLRFADAAMYDAKQRGTGQLALLSAEAASSANNQLRLEDELREAIANDQLVLHYQPVVGPDGAVRSAEALVRWPHPERGMLFPDKFIPVAQRGGLMRDLDRWVLRTATKEAATWPTHLRRPVGVAVNLAGLLPGDVDFMPMVHSALAESGLPGARLVLELVETALVSLPERTLAAMSELADLGVRFAVDDFGTGYSSLSRIKELPAQIVKVDRTFVSGISDDPADFAVCRAVVQMAAAMGRYCVAEGVETAEQFNALRSLGVDAYQGWLFAKAMEPSKFRAILDGPVLPLPANRAVTPPDGLATQALPAGAARKPNPIV